MKAREVKKKLALLLCAAMVLTMMPSSAFSALAELWKVTAITYESQEVTMTAGETKTITFKATVDKATSSDAIVASDQNAALASAYNAMQVTVDKPEVVSAKLVKVDGMNIIVDVTASKDVTEDSTARLTVSYGDVKGVATITVKAATKEEPLKIATMEFVQESRHISISDTDVKGIPIKVTFTNENATPEQRETVFTEFWKDVDNWTGVHAGDKLKAVEIVGWSEPESFESKEVEFKVRVKALAVGSDTLTVGYKGDKAEKTLSTSCEVVVDKAEEAAIKSAKFDKTAVSVGKDGATVNLTVDFNEVTKDDQKAALWATFYKNVRGANTTFDDKVIHINWKENPSTYSAEIEIEAISKGETDLTVNVDGITATCKVTVTEASLRISGMRFEKDTLAIEKDEPTKIKMFIEYSDKDAKEDEKKAVFEKFWTDGKWKIGMDSAVVDVEFPPYFGVSDYDVIRVTITGKMAGQTKLDVVYDGQYAVEKLSAVVDITVNGNNEVEVVPVAPQIAPGASNLGEGVTKAQADAIEAEIAKGTATIGAINADALLEQLTLKDGEDVCVEPEITVQKINVVLEDGKAVVESMEADIDVKVYVVDKSGKKDGQGSLTDYFSYVTVNVPVPAARPADSNYVEWMHQVDGEWGYTDLISTGSYITDGMAQLITSSFSPFRMTFVYRQTITGGSYTGSSSAKKAAVGQWKKAADGIRWWYENADGTWPANGWAQLVWEGKTDWYYFDAEGYMVTGWVTWEGNRYYLHPVSDGTQGHMYTGWQQIDGKWYYFRPESGGPQGSLFVNGTTPDGYKVDANGVWIQ